MSRTFGNTLESETDDEEVKLSCAMRKHRFDYSDSESSQRASGSHPEENDTIENSRQPYGLSSMLKFVAVQPRRTAGRRLVRPTPERGLRRPSPLTKEDSLRCSDSEESAMSSWSKSVARRECTRGAPLFFSDNASSLCEWDDEQGSGAENEPEFAMSNWADSGEQGIGIFSASANVRSLDGVGLCQRNDTEKFIGASLHANDLMGSGRPKRVLSSNTLKALNAEAGCRPDIPKRLKAEKIVFGGEPELRNATPSAPVVDVRLLDILQIRESVLPSRAVVSTCDDDEELDRQLQAELLSGRTLTSVMNPFTMDEYESAETPRDLTPVPLLTPPQSPLTLHMEGGTAVTMCEWPSNLAVDCALAAAATSLQPVTMELSVIQDFEDSDDEGVGFKVTTLRNKVLERDLLVTPPRDSTGPCMFNLEP